jgi:hypothetical protein
MPYGVTYLVEELKATTLEGRVQMISAAHTITGGAIFICDASGGAFTITLPAAGTLKSVTGEDLSQIIVIKKKDSSVNAVTVSRAGSDTIDGATTVSLAAQYDTVILCDDEDGDAWNILQQGSP